MKNIYYSRVKFVYQFEMNEKPNVCRKFNGNQIKIESKIYVIIDRARERERGRENASEQSSFQ